MIDGKNRQIVDKLASLTDSDKLHWKPSEKESRVLVSDTTDLIYKIYLAQDKKKFWFKVYKGEELLIHRVAEDGEVEPNFVTFYDDAALDEPASTILKSLENISPTPEHFDDELIRAAEAGPELRQGLEPHPGAR
jgi:hypothetical protein